MTCGHCVKTITGAVTAAVPGSAVVTDLATHRVTVTGTDQADKVEAAIRDAGYEPARVGASRQAALAWRAPDGFHRIHQAFSLLIA